LLLSAKVKKAVKDGCLFYFGGEGTARIQATTIIWANRANEKRFRNDLHAPHAGWTKHATARSQNAASFSLLERAASCQVTIRAIGAL